MKPVEFNSAVLWRILEVSRALSMPLTLKAVLEQVVDTALEVLNAQRGSVFLFNEEQQELRTQVATGVAQISVPLRVGIVGECASSRNIINVPDCYQDDRFNPEIDKLSGFTTQSLLAIPLIGIHDNLVGVLELMNKRGCAFDESDEKLGSLLVAQCAVALQRAQLFEDHLVREQQDRDISIAREIQRDVLPEKMPEFDEYEIVGWSQSADQTGGDIYDAFAINETHGFFLLADATGHGIGPALSVTQVRSMFRIATTIGSDLSTQLTTINAQLNQDLASNRFVIAFFGILDSQTHSLNYFSAGQAPLLLYSAKSQSWSARAATTIPLGITTGISTPEAETISFDPGDIFAILSDGFFEFANPHDELFGKERVQTVIQRHQKLPLDELLKRLRQSIDDFANGAPQADDMTVILIRRRNHQEDSP